MTEKAPKSPLPLLGVEEEIITRLCKEAQKLPKNSSSQTCTIFAGQTDDFEEQDTIEGVLGPLKKAGAIVNYKYKTTWEKGYDIDDAPFEYPIIWAECDLHIDKLFDCVKKLWQPKRTMVENLAKNYLNLIRIVEIYFKNPQNHDSKLNKFYLETCEEILKLVHNKEISSYLQDLYRKPFDTLFSAEKELQEGATELKDVLNSLNAFYGEIHKLLAAYDINYEPWIKTEEIESYINSLELQEKLKTKNRETENNKGSKSENKKYWISYTKNRDVILNDKYVISTMQFETISDCWFGYIFSNQNKKITRQEIEKETKKSGAEDYDFNKFLDNIKFKGQLRKLFFKQGKQGIIFYNPITEKDFDERVSLNITKLEQEIKKLEEIN